MSYDRRTAAGPKDYEDLKKKMLEVQEKGHQLEKVCWDLSNTARDLLRRGPWGKASEELHILMKLASGLSGGGLRIKALAPLIFRYNEFVRSVKEEGLK